MIQLRKFKRFKLLCFWGLWGFLLSWLISCGSPTQSEAELEFWTMQLQPKFTQYFQETIATFESENPEVEVKWIDVPWSAMESKILTAVSAKTAPDVVNLNPNFASFLATSNAWVDLNTEVPTEIQEKYLANIWEASTIDSLTFGFPWYLTTRITLYNQDLLKRAGIEKPPATYSELASMAKVVKENTGKYGFFVSFVPSDSGEVLESLVQMGVSLVDSQGKAAFNTPDGIQAFRYWVDLYQQDLLPKEVLTQGHRYAIDLYQGGETAILSSGAEFLKAIENNAPSIYQSTAAAPQITGETQKKNVAVMNLVIPRETNKLDSALKFALFVTNTENQLAFAHAANVLPSTVDSIDGYIEDLQQKESSSILDEARMVSALQLKDAEILVPPMKNINRLQKIIYQNLQGAMLNQKTVEEAVTDAANQWDALVSK